MTLIIRAIAMQLCALRRSSRYQQQFAVRHFPRSVLVLEGPTKIHTRVKSCDLQRLRLWGKVREGENEQKISDSVGKHILLASTFYWQVHSIGKCILLASTFYWQVHFIGKHILLASAFYWQVHSIGKYILLASTLYWQAHSIGKYILLASTFYWQVHFNGKHILLASTFYWRVHFPK